MRTKKLLLMYILTCGFFGFFFATNTSAFSVTASVQESGGYCRSYNAEGKCPDTWVTQFDVSITGGCSDCSVEGKFECIDGTSYATPNSSMSGDASFSHTSGGYDYYTLTLSDGQYMHQRIQGTIKKPKPVQNYTLSGVSVNMSGVELGNNPNSKTVSSGSSASISKKNITGYDFQGWRTNKSSGTPSGGDTYTVSSLTSNKTVYAVYQIQKRKLTGKAINTSGNSLSAWISDVSSTVNYGANASITRRAHDAFTFKGWKNASSDSTYTGGTDTSYSKNNLTSNATVYAVYQLKSYKLTIDKDSFSAVTVKRVSSPYANASISNLPNNATIYYGDKLEVTLNTGSATCHPTALGTYTIDGANKTVGTTHDVTVSANVAVYARSPLKSYKLTKSQVGGTTITVKRTSSDAKNGMQVGPDRSHITTLSRDASTGSNASLEDGDTIYCNDKLTTTFALNTGYSWGDYNWAGRANDKKWGYHFQGNGVNDTGPDAATEHTGKTYTGHVVRANVTAETQAVRDEFSGKLTASGGVDTGWVEAGTSKTGSIDCDNYATGCTATFQPALKTVKGTGNTVFSVERSKNGGGWTDVTTNPTSPTKPSTSGTDINKSSGNYNEKLYPGESVCYRITFRPYGVKRNTDTVTLSACVTAKVTNFKGKTAVTGATSGNTGLVDSNTTRRYTVNNCSPTAGCKVRFNHSMARSNSVGSSGWVVSRTSNLTDGNAKINGNAIAIANNGSVASGTFKPSRNDTETAVKNGDELTLYPGMVVCEKLTFDKNNTYSSSNPGSYTRVYSQACVMALGPSQPGDPSNPDNPESPGSDEKSSNDSSFLNIKVRNTSVAKYNKYQHMVYAKPRDVIRFRATYNPILQYTYYLKPERLKIDSGTVNPTTSARNTTNLLGAYFNTLNGCNVNNDNVTKCWNNGFGLSSNFSRDERYNYAKIYTVGSTAKQIEPLDTYTVADNNVGTEKSETAKTNSGNKQNADGSPLSTSNTNKNDLTTAKQVTFTCRASSGRGCTDNASSNDSLGTVDTSRVTKSAYFRVPYNFKTSAKVDTPEDTPIYAGEKTNITFTVGIDPKSNSETTDGSDSQAYTTRADQVREEIVVYNPATVTGGSRSGGIMTGGRTADVCATYFGHANDEVNCGYTGDSTASSLDPGPRSGRIATFYAQDMPAGSQICVAVAVFPADSGLDTNWNDLDYKDGAGNSHWRISGSKCYKIAKKPSLQIWGGNIYTSGGAETATARKNNLQGYTSGYKVGTMLGSDYLFGSWGELGIVSSKSIKELSSGATLGYTDNVSGNLVANPGGLRTTATTNNTNGTICVRSPLTFANTNSSGKCASAGVGALGNSTAKRSSNENRESIIEKYMYKGDPTVTSGQANLADEDGKMRDDSVYYYYSGNSSMTLLSGMVRKGVTKVVHADGKDITIAGNITYEDGYTSFDDMPKLIVYAKNIKINCEVARIDGILIAENKVVTCNNFGGGDVDGSGFEAGVKAHINDKANSKPLTINGTIVANGLVPNRTYGAGTGNNSIVSAETINYDPTLYQWGGQKMESQNANTNLDVMYSRELAPRL